MFASLHPSFKDLVQFPEGELHVNCDGPNNVQTKETLYLKN